MSAGKTYCVSINSHSSESKRGKERKKERHVYLLIVTSVFFINRLEKDSTLKCVYYPIEGISTLDGKLSASVPTSNFEAK